MPNRDDLPPQLKALVGTVLAGRYVVEDAVGLGGMGVVFRGRHAALAREVAIKVLRPQYSSHREVARRFDREARAASGFEHPHCIQVFDCGTTHNGLKFMVMPFLRGKELGHALRRPLPASQAVALSLQILRGLDYAHRRGVIHRDLKPDNIFVVRDHDDREVLKVVDFGIAKIVGEGFDDGMQTKVGAIVGTPAYMSPEQAMGHEVDHRTDLYALGIILYQMLVGRLPFAATDTRGLLYQHVAEAPAPLPPSVPAQLAAVVGKLMAKNPDQRFATAAQTMAAVEYIKQALSQDPTPWVRLLDPPSLGAPQSLGAPPSLAKRAPPPPPFGGAPPRPPSPAMPHPGQPRQPGSIPPPPPVGLMPPPPQPPAPTREPSAANEQLAAVDAALRNILDDGADETALRSGIFEPPPEGWDPEDALGTIGDDES